MGMENGRIKINKGRSFFKIKRTESVVIERIDNKDSQLSRILNPIDWGEVKRCISALMKISADNKASTKDEIYCLFVLTI